MDEKEIYELICDARKRCREMNCRDCDFQNRKDCKYEFMARYLVEEHNIRRRKK